ncbi:MAG: FAD-dependent oxidoreductase, partial [Eubacteriales bacterium]|nr:FAD-dependent oxidoreductase [Eubacteriales bacterium]
LSAVARRLTIYEQTRVTGVEEHALHAQGHTVTARHIVFASHYPFVNVSGYYFMRMHQQRSYLLALEGARPVHGMYIGADEDDYTLRDYGEVLLFGGAGHRTGENTGGGRYEQLRRAAKQLYPAASEAAHWSAQDCMTPDNRPYIGGYSSAQPDWYVATGFGKWGMTSSMVAAMLLADAIDRRENQFSPVFAARRLALSSLPALAKDGAQAVKGLARESLHIPQQTLEAIGPGQGGVVGVGGEKVGVYRDDAGDVFLVDTRCPHLGCQLEWNPDEKSWDCPCHGSRFSYTGQLLDGPAQRDVALA